MSRRGVLGGTAVAGAAALSGGGAYLEFARHARAAASEGASTEVKPGDLDEYYAFNSSGQTGEVRIQVLPSGRELMRIPGVQPRQRHGLGPDQREQEDPHRGTAARDPQIPGDPRRHVAERRPAPSAHVVHRRHLRWSLHLRQRQGELPRRAHPLRRDEDRQDHRDPQRLRHPWPAPAEISAHRLHLRQQRAHHPDSQRRPCARRPEEQLLVGLHGDRRRHA